MIKTCPTCGATYGDREAFCPADGATLIGARTGADLIGSVIADRYRVEKLLGEGGMGRVYLARHVRLPQQAAIKVMHASMASDDLAVARFNREAANAARIEHERVARVFDFGEWGDGIVYLAMEFVPGRTLREIIESDGRLSPERAANIVYQVAEGLDAAHRLGIVHRDLKPDNIMVVTDDQGIDRCKVVDFGIAKTGEGTGTKLTSTGMIVGTPEYMSPEQIVGDPVDARTDVYALALVAFNALTGGLPFSGTTPERVLMSRLMQAPATLAATVPEVAWPDDLQAVFGDALTSEAGPRTPSALAFGEALLSAVERWTGGPVLRGRTPMAVPTVGSRTPAAAMTTVPSEPGAGGARITTGGAATDGPASGDAVARGGGTSTAAGPSPRGEAGPGGGAGANAAPAGAPATTPAAPSRASAAAVAPRPGGGAGGSRAVPFAIVGVVAAALVAWFAFTRGAASEAPAAAAADSARVATQLRDPAEPAPARAPEDGEPSGGRDAAAAQRPQGGATPSGSTTRQADQRSESAAVVAPPPPPAPVAAGSGTAAGPAPGTTPAAAATAAAARRELDAIRARLAADESGEAEAREAIPRLQRVLRDLGSASDSVWAYLAIVGAMGQAGEGQRACGVLRSARRLATSEAQRQAVDNFFASEALACVP